MERMGGAALENAKLIAVAHIKKHEALRRYYE